MASEEDGETDLRSRFASIQALEGIRDAFVLDLLEKLELVTETLDVVTKERDRKVGLLRADLESERESRRGWQDKAQVSRDRLALMKQARFVLILIDADADMYLFHERLLARGLVGGQAAADEFMAKVREYLVSQGSSAEDANTIPIVVKAYANLNGLAQACVRDKRVKAAADVVQFWIGFTRQYPFVDFVDVGAGKEEADNKLREVLGHHIANPQCEHVMLACCHDAGYTPVLRQYAAPASCSERITLISVGEVRPEMATLRFRTTALFEELFRPKVSTSGNGRSRQEPGVAPSSGEASSSVVSGKPVSNSDRLRPIILKDSGKRTDKVLAVDKTVAKRISKKNLCIWHYLRSDCVRDCKRSHSYPRPLSSEEFDALWLVARQGPCRNSRKDRVCEDDQCIYGHH